MLYRMNIETVLWPLMLMATDWGASARIPGRSRAQRGARGKGDLMARVYTVTDWKRVARTCGAIPKSVTVG